MLCSIFFYRSSNTTLRKSIILWGSGDKAKINNRPERVKDRREGGREGGGDWG